MEELPDILSELYSNLYKFKRSVDSDIRCLFGKRCGYTRFTVFWQMLYNSSQLVLHRPHVNPCYPANFGSVGIFILLHWIIWASFSAAQKNHIIYARPNRFLLIASRVSWEEPYYLCTAKPASVSCFACSLRETVLSMHYQAYLCESFRVLPERNRIVYALPSRLLRKLPRVYIEEPRV